ncbi:unnamed protein product, partial [Mesorhabditis belari]|uniref:C2H2-type domain-containing protein n=1 Tax=Mesorhabditis belari TaxID=2138241 RepID=A0AAF3FP58_9BILA
MEVEDLFPTQEEILAGGPYQCDECGTIVSHGRALRLHRVQVHKIIETLSDQRILNPSIQIPIETSIKTKRFHCCDQKCIASSRSFLSMKLLKQHFQKCHVPKSLTCHQCSKHFSLARDLAFHLKKKCKGTGKRMLGKEMIRTKEEFSVKVLNNGQTLNFTGPMPDEGFSLLIRRSGNSGVHVEVVPNNSMANDLAITNLISTQTDITCLTQETQSTSMFDCDHHRPSTSLWEANDYVRQNVFCQTASSSVPPTNDFGTQIDSSLAENYLPQMRHVETTMDLPILGEDWRSIETQTTWTNEDSCFYNWYDEVGSLPEREDGSTRNGNLELN